MRIPALAMVAAGAAASSVLAIAPARAATTPVPPYTPTYTCQTIEWAGGGEVYGGTCIASNGAPTSGFISTPVIITGMPYEQGWFCDAGADATAYPAGVLGEECQQGIPPG